MARAPPAGKMFATALEPRFTTAASRSRTDGSTEQIMIQAEAMLAAAAAAMSRACGHVIACMLAHTLRYDAKRGRANKKITATWAAGRAVRKIFRPFRGRGRAVSGCCMAQRPGPIPGAVSRSGDVIAAADGSAIGLTRFG